MDIDSRMTVGTYDHDGKPSSVNVKLRFHVNARHCHVEGLCVCIIGRALQKFEYFQVGIKYDHGIVLSALFQVF